MGRDRKQVQYVSGITKHASSITCFVESYIRAHNSSRGLNNEHLRTNCLHTSSPDLSDPTESRSWSDSHVTAGHTFLRRLTLHFFTESHRVFIHLHHKSLPVPINCKKFLAIAGGKLTYFSLCLTLSLKASLKALLISCLD